MSAETQCELGYPPASEASREVANLTEIKNPRTPLYGASSFRLFYAEVKFLTQKLLPKLAPYTRGYEICPTNFTST